MEKHYYIDLRDLEGLSLLQDVDIYLKYKYVKIVTKENDDTDKILTEKSKTFIHPYCIMIIATDGTHKKDIKYYFQGISDKQLQVMMEHMFKQMMNIREVYLQEEDYEFIKEKIEIYEKYLIKGTDYYKIVVPQKSVIVRLNYPYYDNGRYYNIKWKSDIDFLDKTIAKETEEM